MIYSSVGFFIWLWAFLLINALYAYRAYKLQRMSNARFLVCVAFCLVLLYEIGREVLVVFRGEPFPITGTRIHVVTLEYTILGAWIMLLYQEYEHLLQDHQHRSRKDSRF